jgi:spore coat polysaccharide biosynthesis protein SpsF
MHVCAVIQARMSSTRLPGKVMLPLADRHVLTQDVSRVSASGVDEVVVATSDLKADDIVARYAERAGATVFRGSESDVLGRMYGAATRSGADIVVRITADCPLISPTVIDGVVDRLVETGADYCSNTLDRSFPRGLDTEAVTFESFERVAEEATESSHREHVMPYYHANTERFERVNLSSEEVFDEPWMQNRDDLRLTLDEADDYEVLREVYDNVPSDGLIDIRDAVEYVDENDLMSLNAGVEQKAG